MSSTAIEESTEERVEGNEDSPREDASARISTLKRKACEKLSEIFRDSLPPIKRSRKDDDTVKQFLSRVATFKAPLWKPGCVLNPREFAVLGWRVVGDSLLKCDHCAEFLAISLPNLVSVDIQVYTACLRKVRQSAKSIHELTCPARAGVQPDFFGGLLNRDKIRDDICDRVKSLRILNLPENVEVSEEEVDVIAIMRSLGIKQEEWADPRLVVLASLGFSGQKDGRSISCALCCRVLTPYTGMPPLTPSKQHFGWCPLLDPRPTHDLPQWRSALETLLAVPVHSILECSLSAKRTLSLSVSSLHSLPDDTTC